VLLCPIKDQAEHPVRKGSSHHSCLNFDRDTILTEPRVEVGSAVLLVEHPDDDSQKP